MPKRGLIVKVIISALILSFGHTLPAHADQYPCYIVTGGIITNIGSCTGAVVVGSEVTGIGDGVFDPFSGWDSISPQKFITSIDLSTSSVVSIGDHAFSNNSQLETVTLSATLRTIGPSAFAGNQNLRSINFLEGLSSIGPCAFCMAQIRQIVIPDTVTDIAIDAFIGNEALVSVNIGAGLVNLGMNAIPTSFQGTVIVSTGNRYFKAEGGKLFTMAGEQLTGFPQPSEMPMSDSGPKNDDGNSVPILEKGFSNRQGQSQNGGNDVVNGDQQPDNSAQAAATTEAARVAAAQAIAAEAARVAAAQAAAAEVARIAAEIKAAEVAKAKSDLKNILQNDGKPSFDTFKAAGIEGITQKNVEKVSEKILTLPVEQRSNPVSIEKMITVVTFFDPETPPTIADFANKGIGTVTNKIVSKVAIELLRVPESQQGDVAVIKQIVQRVATVDRLSTPETSKSVQASDLVAINALSNSNTKKVTITSALKKLDPSSIDTFQEVLAEIAKQEAIIKARAEKSAAIKAKLAARSSKP